MATARSLGGIVESWVAELTNLNLTAVYDVALDLKDAAQLAEHAVIPILPSVVRFPILMPVDGVNMRDRYAELRWNAAKFLEQKGVIRNVQPLTDPYSHRWQGRLQCQVDQTVLSNATAALRAEYQRRAQTESGGTPVQGTEPLSVIRDLLLRFHTVATLLRNRHGNRATLDVTDEYDVQDLLRALLALHFDDVRVEESTPSYAGGAARMDFLLKRERIVVEVKKTRPTLSDRDLGDQLVLDAARYAKHPDCRTLVCFVYDPENRITNPGGLQADLGGIKDGLKVEVLIAPKTY